MAVIKSISLNNFRIFDKMTKFELAPLTLLTGANNSGKSSLIKALLLLADNAKKNGLNELDFSGDTHHLDNFQYVKNRDSKDDRMFFAIKYSIGSLGDPDFIFIRDEIELQMTYTQNTEGGELIKYSIWDKDVKLLEINRNPSSLHTFYINTPYFLKRRSSYYEGLDNFKNKIVFGIEKSDRKPYSLNFHYKDSIKNDKNIILLDELITNYLCKIEISEDVWNEFIVEKSISNSFRQATFSDIRQFFKNIRFSFTLSSAYFSLKPTLSEVLSKSHRDLFSHLANKRLDEVIESEAFSSNEFNDFIDNFIDKGFNELAKEINIGYIECFKANSQRIYSNQSQGTRFNELLLKTSRIVFDKDIQAFIIKWLKIFGIGDDFRLERIRGVATEIKIIRDGVDLDLVDLGFGYTQIFPLILQIALYAQETTIINLFDGDKRIGDFTILIEEPEANLHPKFQSKLIDLFLDATNTFGFHFIIETHSEYMIRRAQIVVANNTKAEKEKSEKEGDISEPKSEYIKSVSDNIRLYYFYEPKHVPKGRNQIEEIKILSDGRLDKEFGEGFFDEATNLQIELLKLKNRIN